MSADLYTSEIDSDKYGDMRLEMFASGLLKIVSINPASKALIDPESEGIAQFSLPPTPEGWKEAENLIGALQEWVRHTKELEEQRIWAEGLTKGLDR